MKKIFLSLVVMLIGVSVFASEQEAKTFFNRYVSAANNYSTSVPNFYSPNAKIIRQVIKPNGALVNVPFKMSDYKTQMKISSSVAKMKKYKNYYSDIKVTKINDKTYKISAYRQPSTGGPKLKTETTVQEQKGGNWLIIEELMQTKEQVFLKYAK